MLGVIACEAPCGEPAEYKIVAGVESPDRVQLDQSDATYGCSDHIGYLISCRWPEHAEGRFWAVYRLAEASIETREPALSASSGG